MSYKPTKEETAQAEANQATQTAKTIEAIVDRVHDRVIKAAETAKPQ